MICICEYFNINCITFLQIPFVVFKHVIIIADYRIFV